MEETTSFLNSLLASHGPNYLEKLFGRKAQHRLRELGGVNQVAIALSGEQQTKSLLRPFRLIFHETEFEVKLVLVRSFIFQDSYRFFSFLLTVEVNN